MTAKPSQKLIPPNNQKRILMHSCCATCSGTIISAMVANGIDLTVFYYNPNIQPKEEYEIRKNENKRYAKKLNVPFVDADYDPPLWFARTQGHEEDPERGDRCSLCFSLRLEHAAAYAQANGFQVFTSSLGISRWKDMDQVNACGLNVARRFPGLTYWTFNWRKEGGSSQMYTIARDENFYKQEYCGCVYSKRDADISRKSKGVSPIQTGSEFYTT